MKYNYAKQFDRQFDNPIGQLDKLIDQTKEPKNTMTDEQLNIKTLKENGYSDEQIARMDILQITELALKIGDMEDRNDDSAKHEYKADDYEPHTPEEMEKADADWESLRKGED